MQSAAVLVVLAAGALSLQGCGSSGDDPVDPPICHYEQTDPFVCPGHGNEEVFWGNFKDLNNGDVKQVVFVGDTMNITSSASWNRTSAVSWNKTWYDLAELDGKTCSGIETLAEPGHLLPLTFTISASVAVEKDCKSPTRHVITFSDHNQWIEAGRVERHIESTNLTCPMDLAGIFVSSSGSQSQITVEGGAMTITPHGAVTTASPNPPTIEATIDNSTCSGSTTDASPQGIQIRLKVSPGQTVQEAEATPTWYVMMTAPSESGPTTQWVQLPPSVITV